MEYLQALRTIQTCAFRNFIKSPVVLFSLLFFWAEDHTFLFSFALLPTRYTWRASITGPEETAWEGGIFGLRLKFDGNYPVTAELDWTFIGSCSLA
jgi:hypothetical protein